MPKAVEYIYDTIGSLDKALQMSHGIISDQVGL